MPTKIPPLGIGAPDYTLKMSKVALASIFSETQEEYWVATSLNVEPNQALLFTIEKGFSEQYEYVPQGKVFLLDEYEVSTDGGQSLIEVGVAVQDRTGTLTAKRWDFGYGKGKLAPKRAIRFFPDTRPVYYIVNYHPTATISCRVNIYGLIENYY